MQPFFMYIMSDAENWLGFRFLGLCSKQHAKSTHTIFHHYIEPTLYACRCTIINSIVHTNHTC